MRVCVQVAVPPLQRVSGVPGLALDDYCSVATSFKTLSKTLNTMASKKKGTMPPLRESRLTHLLASALGDEGQKVHCLVYVPTQRRHKAEATAALSWAGKAVGAKLRKGVYQ